MNFDPDLPEAVPLSTIIECNCQLATNVNEHNSVYTNIFEGRTIQPGGTITARLTSIDSQKNTSTDILIGDSPISFVFSYVDMDYDGTNKEESISGNPWPAVTYNYYAGYKDIDYIELQAAAVRYSGAPLPFTVDFQAFYYAIITFAWIDLEGNQQNNAANPYQGLIVAQQSPVEVLCDPYSSAPIRYREGTLQLLNIIGRNGYGDVLPPTDFTYLPLDNVTQIIQNLGIQLNKKVFSLPIPPGPYDPGELAVRLTQILEDSGGVDQGVDLWIPNNQLLTRMDNPANAELIWRRCEEFDGAAIIFDDTNTYKYQNTYPLQKGAQIASIEYGKVGPVFQLSALHSPIYNAASPGTRNVAYFHANNIYHEIPVDSKIVIHESDPPEFLQVLGLEGIIVPLSKDANNVEFYSRSRMLASTTSENTPIGAFCPNFNPVVADPVAAPKYIDTTGINPKGIIGTPANPNADGPVYLIRVTGLGAISDYAASDTVINDVGIIVSKEYTASNITTGFEDSAVLYTHTGAPKTISSITISIIDPNTKQPVKNLGPNTLIHLQIDNPKPTAPPPKDESISLLRSIRDLLKGDK